MASPTVKPTESLLAAALRNGRTAFMIAALFSLVSNLLYLALPIFTNQVYGRVLTSGSMPTLVVLTAGTLFVFLVSSALDLYRGRVLTNFGVAFDQQVSSHVFAAIFDNFTRREPGQGSQPLRDLDQFRQVATGSGISVLFDLPWLPIYLIVLFFIDPAVGTLTLIGGMILCFLAYMQDRASRPALKSANEAAIHSYNFAEAGLRNSEVVRAMGLLPHIGREWMHHRATAMGRGMEAGRSSEYWANSIKFVRLAIQILIIALGAWLIIDGKIGAGLLFANMILSSRALAPIERAVGTYPALVSASQAYDRLIKLLVDYKPATKGTALPRPKGQLSVEGVSVGVPGSAGRLILTAISFAVPPGTFLGVIGPSGAGKSTLARLLVGVWPPLSGSIRLDGADVFGWSRTDFGRHVGYLPQDTELFAGTVRNNIARFMPDVTDEEVVEAAQSAGVHEMIVRLPNGYDTQLGGTGVILSAGQRQRVGLARAMLKKPAFIVLDEPNANLDAVGEQALLTAVKRMKADGTTVVMISHKPSMLTDADMLVVLRDGKMDLFGPADQVMARLSANAQPRPAVAPLPANQSPTPPKAVATAVAAADGVPPPGAAPAPETPAQPTEIRGAAR